MVQITRHGRPAAVPMSADDVESLQETITVRTASAVTDSPWNFQVSGRFQRDLRRLPPRIAVAVTE